MAAPTWATDALGTALVLLGQSGKTLARLNQRANRDHRTAVSTTISANATLTGTSLTVASATGFPSTPFFARIVPPAGAAVAWASATNYVLSDIRRPTVANGYLYIVTNDAGSSGGTEPTWPTTPGATVVDGGITWTCFVEGEEIVKVTNVAGTTLTVTRKGRGTKSSGTTLVGEAYPTRAHRSGAAFHVTGTYVGLTAGSALGTVTLATSANADDIIDTATAHNMVAGQRVVFTALTGGAGLVTNRPYWVVATSLGAQTFRVADTRGGTPLGFTTDITAGTIQPWGYYTDADAAALGTVLSKYFGIHKGYGRRVFEMASRYAKRTLTLTIVD